MRTTYGPEVANEVEILLRFADREVELLLLPPVDVPLLRLDDRPELREALDDARHQRMLLLVPFLFLHARTHKRERGRDHLSSSASDHELQLMAKSYDKRMCLRESAKSRRTT